MSESGGAFSFFMTVTREQLEELKRRIALGESMCATQEEVDQVAPAVMRELFPQHHAMIDAAIATRRPIHIALNWMSECAPAESRPR